MGRHTLSRSLKPSHYELCIDPYIESATFDGSITIEVEINEPTTVITINSHKLAIRSTTLFDGKGDPIKVSDTGGDSTLQTFSILLEKTLPSKSRIFIYQKFSGFLNKTGIGFHTTEVHRSGMLSTLFEPMHARTVFPCFDEPCFKATWAVKVVVPVHLTCLGNMPIKSESESSVTTGGKKTVEFRRTPPIPTYLLAFAVGEFNSIENHDIRIPIRAYAPRNYEVEHCRYALDVAARVLAIYEQIFGLTCGLEKLDILAVPGSVGAMENWGLVTVSSAVLFISPDSTVAEKMSCAQLIAHEIGHQWFGNLVTMSSWENFWLKEALADWAEIMAQERLFDSLPSQDFVSEKMQRALCADSSHFTHALVGAGTHLDPITYGKGVSVMRMLAGHIGKDKFLQGIRRFMRQKAYGNGDPEDLWEVLSHISGSDIGAVMKSWTDNAGYPVINVEESEADSTITLTQSPFSLSKIENTTSYPIFLDILTSQGILRERLDEQSKTIELPLHFYKLNPGQIGFYRVAYSISRLEKLGDEVCRGTLSVEDRIGLIFDTAALAFAGHAGLQTSHFLSLVQKFVDETNLFVWTAIIATLREISKRLLFEDHITRNAFMDFQWHLVKRCLYWKGKFNDHESMEDLRLNVLLFGNSGGDERVVADAYAMFENFTAGDGKMLNPNIRAEVFEIVLKRGGKKEYKRLLKRFETSSGSTRKDIMRSLGYCQNNACIKKTIQLATSPEIIADVGLRPALESLSTHRKGIYALWRFIASDIWTKCPGLTLAKIAPVGQMVLDCLTKIEYSEGARKYLESMDSNMLDSDAEQCFEGIEVRAAWLERDREDLIGWLRKNRYYKHGSTKIWRSMNGVRDALEYLGCI
ncbi:Aminopeptidase 2 mitochondrial [Cadophora gregata]|uniref:Aminopeptidase 2 mitochondrial n=1 Tax=Cadophora gregata TaxID=51156 RepID=UPI0026DC2C8C|nr:Aminopeptidase 2 mitochondrial [Cadophora gregata]KAK0107228.1 Aminopeptidase 2 mitochondrial [Cadophora gregata]